MPGLLRLDADLLPSCRGAARDGGLGAALDAWRFGDVAGVAAAAAPRRRGAAASGFLGAAAGAGGAARRRRLLAAFCDSDAGVLRGGGGMEAAPRREGTPRPPPGSKRGGVGVGLGAAEGVPDGYGEEQEEEDVDDDEADGRPVDEDSGQWEASVSLGPMPRRSGAQPPAEAEPPQRTAVDAAAAVMQGGEPRAPPQSLKDFLQRRSGGPPSKREAEHAFLSFRSYLNSAWSPASQLLAATRASQGPAATWEDAAAPLRLAAAVRRCVTLGLPGGGVPVEAPREHVSPPPPQEEEELLRSPGSPPPREAPQDA